MEYNKILKLSIIEIDDLLERGKLSTCQVNRAYLNKMREYNKYCLDNDLRKKRGHNVFQEKYGLVMDLIKSRSCV